MNTRFMFSFQKCKMSWEFCRSFIGGRHRSGYCYKNHKFEVPVRAILVPSEQIVGGSGDRAPVRLAAALHVH